MHNLEALLRSSSVQSPTILDLMTELKSSASVLRGAFERAIGTDAAASEVGELGRVTMDGFDALLEAMATVPADRVAHAAQARDFADEPRPRPISCAARLGGRSARDRSEPEPGGTRGRRRPVPPAGGRWSSSSTRPPPTAS